jgi:hypothetical protein
MSSILIVLFMGITLLANQIQAVPSHTETVISQIARTIYGGGTIPYIMTMAGTAVILLMAANTSYADFPRLAALQARDGFLPRQLTFRGSRLVFSWGITVLAMFASVLVVIGGASVSALIPLYAVGVFLSFTLSQAGMARRFWKAGHLKPGEVGHSLETELVYEPGWRHKMVISAFGATVTGVVMLVFAVTKFASGAWMVVLLIPVLVFIFFRIHNHYKDVAETLSLKNRPHCSVMPNQPVQTVVLVDHVHAGTIKLVNFAKSLGQPWHAIHIDVNPELTERVLAKWEKYVGSEGELRMVPSPYRHLAEPIRDYIKELLEDAPNSYVHLVMGHLVMDTFWEQALHQNSAFIFNMALTGLERVVVTIVPYQIHHLNGHVMVPEAPLDQMATSTGPIELKAPDEDLAQAAD